MERSLEERERLLLPIISDINDDFQRFFRCLDQIPRISFFNRTDRFFVCRYVYLEWTAEKRGRGWNRCRPFTVLKGVTGRRERFIEPDKGRILSEICPVVNSPIEMSWYNESACSCIEHKLSIFRIGEKWFDKPYPTIFAYERRRRNFLTVRLLLSDSSTYIFPKKN